MNWKKEIIKETRGDGTIYYKPYITMIEDTCLPFYKKKTKFEIGKTVLEERYFLFKHFFGTWGFKDEQYMHKIVDRLILEKEKEISHSKVLKKEKL